MRLPLASRLTGATALLAALALTLAACGGGGGGKTDIAGVKANDHGTKDVTNLTQLEIEQDNYYFNPSVLKGKPGQKLTIELKNETSDTEHNFSQSAQNINKDVAAGKTETVTVTFPASGIISFFCEYHKDMGMAGGLQSS
ncbi:MAG: Cupredoxin-like domain [Frankiales bacterium]|jgi:plastocyanin|nr:Cupredoxin-like domain [Frankiales bacterium]